jgi:hypothetical protein
VTNIAFKHAYFAVLNCTLVNLDDGQKVLYCKKKERVVIFTNMGRHNKEVNFSQFLK